MLDLAGLRPHPVGARPDGKRHLRPLNARADEAGIRRVPSRALRKGSNRFE